MANIENVTVSWEVTVQAKQYEPVKVFAEMSAQLEEVTKAFDSYKAVKMSSQKLADVVVEKVELTPIQAKQAKFLEDVKRKI